VIFETMKFCPNCDNILIPRNKKLFCKACDQDFNLEKDQQKEYTIVKHMKHEDKEIKPIIIKNGLKTSKISQNDRKAFEEFFGSGSESGY